MRAPACVTAVIVAASSLGAQQPASTIVNPVAPAAKSIAAGRQLFQSHCAPCHGKEARGNGPLAPKNVYPPDLTDTEWVHGRTDGEIFTNIRDGIGPRFDMKAMKSRMTDSDIWNVVNYLRSIGTR